MQDPITTQAEVQTRVSSATTPAILLALATLTGGLALMTIVPTELQGHALSLAFLGPILAALQIIFFTFFDRDRLHTEKHLERRAIIQRTPPTLGDANAVIEIKDEPNLVLIGNPSAEGMKDA